MKTLEVLAVAALGLALLSGRRGSSPVAPAAGEASQYSAPVTLPYVQGVGGGLGPVTGTIDLALAAQQDWNATHDPRATTSDTLAAFLRELPRPQWENQLTVWYRTLPDKEMIHLAQAKALGAI